MLTRCLHFGNFDQKSRYSLWQCPLKQGESDTRLVERVLLLVISWSRARWLARRCMWREFYWTPVSWKGEFTMLVVWKFTPINKVSWECFSSYGMLPLQGNTNKWNQIVKKIRVRSIRLKRASHTWEKSGLSKVPRHSVSLGFCSRVQVSSNMGEQSCRF